MCNLILGPELWFWAIFDKYRCENEKCCEVEVEDIEDIDKLRRCWETRVNYYDEIFGLISLHVGPCLHPKYYLDVGPTNALALISFKISIWFLIIKFEIILIIFDKNIK